MSHRRTVLHSTALVHGREDLMDLQTPRVTDHSGRSLRFFSSRSRHTSFQGDWSSDVCSSDPLETLQKVDTLALDKTGTLTQGKPELMSVVAVGGETEDRVVRLVASLEQGSEHPLAAAIVEAAQANRLHLMRSEEH